MARIRTIKPAFFRHTGLYEAEQEYELPLRVAFAGIWTAADRLGRFRWEPRELKLDCLPYDEVDFSRVLDALATRGFIVKYASEGREYGCIPSWGTHQFINNREGQSELPEPNDANILARATRVPDASPTREGNYQGEGKGREGKGKEMGTRQGTRPPARFEEFWKAYPRRDGSNPKQPALKIFHAAVKSGHDPSKIIAGAERYRAELRAKGNEGTPYVAQAMTWLRQARWDDDPAGNGHDAGPSIEMQQRTWAALLKSERETGVWQSQNVSKSDIPAAFIAEFEATP